MNKAQHRLLSSRYLTAVTVFRLPAVTRQPTSWLMWPARTTILLALIALSRESQADVAARGDAVTSSKGIATTQKLVSNDTIQTLPPAPTHPSATKSKSTSPGKSNSIRNQNSHKAPADAVPAWLLTMGKVIVVSSLKLPPTSQPLSDSMRAANVPSGTPVIAAASVKQPKAAPARAGAAAMSKGAVLPRQITMASDASVVLLTPDDLQMVAAGDPKIVDVKVLNARAVLLSGVARGITSLILVGRSATQRYQVRVAALSSGALNGKKVEAAIKTPGIKVRALRDTLILEGEAANADESRQAAEIASVFSPKVLNHLTIKAAPPTPPQPPAPSLATQVQTAVNIPTVTARSVGSAIVLEGTVDTIAQQQAAESLAKLLAPNVLNLTRLSPLTLEQVTQMFGGAPIAAAATGTTTNPATENAAGAANAAGTANAAGATNAVGAANPAGAMNPTSVPGSAPRFMVHAVGNQLILEGTATTSAEIELALALAGRTGFPVVNRLQVAPALTPEAVLISTVTAAIGRPEVSVRGTAKRLVLQGTVPDTNAAVAAEQIARAYSTEVDNMLETSNPALVRVDISIVEINNLALRELGITFPALQESGVGFFQLETKFQASLRALFDRNDAKLLSHPRTTVLSGRTATFQVGGQVPIPLGTFSGTGLATTTIVFKDFGILLDVIPSANARGVVTMRVRAEVSAVDASLGARVENALIPGFTRRTTMTEVTVQPGGTLALGGLIRNDLSNAVRRVPILSNLPILGTLFKSRRYQRQQSDLVIFVTPTVLPNPLAAGLTAPAGVVAMGNTTNVGTVLGNPGIVGFNSNGSFIGAKP